MHLIDNFVYQMKFGFFEKPEICPKMRPKTLKHVQQNCLACHVSAAHDLSVAQASVCKRAVQHTCACSFANAVRHKLLPQQLAIQSKSCLARTSILYEHLSSALVYSQFQLLQLPLVPKQTAFL